MEDGLVLNGAAANAQGAAKSLNPYCSGRWSRTTQVPLITLEVWCLNPYCSGRWSRTL